MKTNIVIDLRVPICTNARMCLLVRSLRGAVCEVRVRRGSFRRGYPRVAASSYAPSACRGCYIQHRTKRLRCRRRRREANPLPSDDASQGRTVSAKNEESQYAT